MNRIIRISLVFYIVLSSWTLHAEIYKWVDENGRTHYGEKPPNEEATEMKIRENEQEPEAGVEKHKVDRDKLLEIYEEEREQKKQEKQKAEEAKKKQEKYCQGLENDLKDMDRGGVYYVLDENGERKYVSEETVASRKKELQEEYEKNCE